MTQKTQPDLAERLQERVAARVASGESHPTLADLQYQNTGNGWEIDLSNGTDSGYVVRHAVHFTEEGLSAILATAQHLRGEWATVAAYQEAWETALDAGLSPAQFWQQWDAQHTHGSRSE